MALVYSPNSTPQRSEPLEGETPWPASYRLGRQVVPQAALDICKNYNMDINMSLYWPLIDAFCNYTCTISSDPAVCDDMQCALVKPERHAELSLLVSCVY